METEKDPQKVIRTYQGDIEQQVGKQKTSLVDIVAAEERAREEKQPRQQTPPPRQRKTMLLTVSAILLITAGTGIFFITRQPDDEIVIPTVTVIPSAIFVNQRKEIPLDTIDGNRAKKIITSEIKEADLPLGSILQLYFTLGTDTHKRIIAARDFFTLLEIKVSDELITSLDSLFTFGVHAFDANQPFLIFKTEFYGTIFTEMLRWENNIRTDLPFLLRDPIISEDELEAIPAGSIRLDTNGFRDVVVANRDARALFDNTGRIRMIYSFPDRETLIITTNENSLREVFDRLRANQ